jgi:hypothetical protein
MRVGGGVLVVKMFLPDHLINTIVFVVKYETLIGTQEMVLLLIVVVKYVSKNVQIHHVNIVAMNFVILVLVQHVQ